MLGNAAQSPAAWPPDPAATATSRPSYGPALPAPSYIPFPSGTGGPAFVPPSPPVPPGPSVQTALAGPPKRTTAAPARVESASYTWNRLPAEQQETVWAVVRDAWAIGARQRQRRARLLLLATLLGVALACLLVVLSVADIAPWRF